MRLIFTHMWAQARYRLFTWRGLFYSTFGTMLIMVDWPTPALMEHHTNKLVSLAMAYVVSVFLYMGILSSDKRGTQREFATYPIPTLPLSNWKRITGDIGLLALVVFVMRISFVGLFSWIRTMGWSNGGTFANPGGFSFLLDACWGTLYVIPFLALTGSTLQASPSSANKPLSIYTKTLIWMIAMYAMLSSHWMQHPVVFALVCVTFIPLAFVLSSWVKDVSTLFPTKEWRGALHRSYQNHSALLFRDLLFGALPKLLALSALAHGTGWLRGRWSAPSGMSIGNMGLFAFELALLTSSILIAFFPILAKISFLQAGEKGRAVGACYALPVPKSLMLRHFFVYGLIISTLLWFGVFSADLLKPMHTFKMTQVVWSTTWIATKILMPTVWIFLLASIFVFLGARSRFWSVASVFVFVFSLNFKFLARYGFAVSTMTIVAFSIILFLMIGLYPLFFPPTNQLPKTAASTHPAL